MPPSKGLLVVCSPSRNHTPSWNTWMLALFLFELNQFRSTLMLSLPVAAFSVHIRVPRNHNCTPLITSNFITGINCSMASVLKHATCPYQCYLSMCVSFTHTHQSRRQTQDFHHLWVRVSFRCGLFNDNWCLRLQGSCKVVPVILVRL